MLLGSMMLIRTGSSMEVVKISRSVIIFSTAITALFFLFIIGLGLRAQRRKVVTGIEGLIGATGESLDILDSAGTVLVQGETWNAESIAGKINKGEKIRVTAMKDLKLYVEKINS